MIGSNVSKYYPAKPGESLAGILEDPPAPLGFYFGGSSFFGFSAGFGAGFAACCFCAA